MIFVNLFELRFRILGKTKKNQDCVGRKSNVILSTISMAVS